MTGPLVGVRVISVEQYGAGPFATMLLADMGAEVVKIEEPGVGDVGRYVPPYLADQDSLYFQSLNRNKKSVALDLRTAAGRDAFDRLVAASDGVFNNLRGDQSAQRRLDYASLRTTNERIVCTHLSGFGRVGERATMPGYDYIMQGYAGWMSLTGEPDGPPQKSGLSMVDLSAGVLAALGTVAAIHNAKATGTGGDVDIPLFDTAISMLTYVGAWHLTTGYVPQRLADSSHPSQVPSQLLPTADGWLVVMCAKEKFFTRLVGILGDPSLADDPRYRTFSDRLENRASLVSRLRELSRTRTTEAWLSALGDQVPCAPVYSVPEALADPHAARLIRTVPHEVFGAVSQLASPIQFSGPLAPMTRAPRLGEHTAQVLSDIGLTANEVDALTSVEGKNPEW
jgi:crotonobetainyl-CoA:carnitine CoA-transferase CaiB-like acyl-CoA transferase